jgi:hypothetical protein
MKAFLPGIGKVNCYSVKSCTWKEDDDGNWATKCGNLYVTNYGTPRENKMKFCCFCGNKLRQVVTTRFERIRRRKEV